jgi:hypothetical protein
MTQQPATNRRHAGPRVTVAIELHLARKVGSSVTALTSDLSAGGARVVCRRPLRIDEELHFDFDLPAGGPHLDGTVRVLRQHLHDTYALRFEHVAAAGQRHLGAYIDANAGAGIA